MWLFKVSTPKRWSEKESSELTCKWSLVCISLIFICKGVNCTPFILPSNTDLYRSVTLEKLIKCFQMWLARQNLSVWLARRILSLIPFTDEDQRHTNQASLTGNVA